MQQWAPSVSQPQYHRRTKLDDRQALASCSSSGSSIEAPDLALEGEWNILADDCVFTVPGNLDQTAILTTQIEVDNDVDTLIVEAHVGIAGLRAGNADPGAGYVAAAFQAPGECLALPSPGPIPIVPSYACAFRVVAIAAYFR